MASSARIGARRGHIAAVDVQQWPEVDPDALSDKRRALYLKRRQAVTMYLAGASDADLMRDTGIALPTVHRLITRRCLAQHPDGTLMGWRGALPFYRVEPYTRANAPRIKTATGRGSAGVMQWLFESPGGAALQARFDKKILGRAAKLASTKRPKQELFQWFLKQLRDEGYEARGEWPFNVARLGCVSIYRYIDRVLEANPRRQQQLLGGEEAERKARAGDGTRRPDLKVFQRVECDAHKIDARMVVLVPSPHGGHEPRKIHRIWVIVIIEVASRAVLGYYLSLRWECSAEDVLRAVKSALTRWTRREIHWSKETYSDSAALPSAHHERYLGACWDEFSVDGALANVCQRVERQLRDVVGANILKPQDPNSFSHRRSKDDRPFIESFFKQLAGGGFHRLASTTGSKPADKRGSDPDKAAVDRQFQLEYAEELLDTLIANYNARPHSGLGWRSPLTQLDFLVDRSPGRLRQADASEVRRMVGIRKLCTVKGGIRSGRRPHFNFLNASYSAEWLALRADLIGKLLWVQLEDEDDARFASVSTKQGEFLGVVRAGPPWHRSPHTLYMRQSIRALAQRRVLHLSTQCDGVEELIRFAEASKDKKLPPHPAYLEARRVLQRQAESASTPLARTATTPALAASPAPMAGEQRESSAALPPSPDVSSIRPSDGALPPRRNAKTW